MPPVTRPVSPQAEAAINRALGVLRERGVTDDYCPRCAVNEWNVDLIALPAISLPNPSLQPHLVPTIESSGYIPVLAIVCKKCGYTIFHNLNLLDVSTE